MPTQAFLHHVYRLLLSVVRSYNMLVENPPQYIHYVLAIFLLAETIRKMTCTDTPTDNVFLRVVAILSENV